MGKYQQLAKKVLQDGVIDAVEATELRNAIYANAVIGKEELDFVFKLNDEVTGKDNDVKWTHLFIEVGTDFALSDKETPGEVDDDETEYLISKIKGDGQVDKLELALMINIIDKAEKCTDKFIDFVLESLKKAVVADGKVDATEVAQMKIVIYGSGGASGEAVDKKEAEFLFDINDIVSGKDNCPEWSEFFVEALTKYTLEDEVSPNELDEQEAKFLIMKFENDGKIDENEKALAINIVEEAEKCADIFVEFVEKLKN